MSFLEVVLFLLILFGIELLYFEIARKFKIIDKPNHRSSHSRVTIRGGGVIFCVAMLLLTLLANESYYYFLAGLLLISVISFFDDVSPVRNSIRIAFHLSASALLFYQLGLYALPFYWILLAFFFVIGTINAVNFMDGINGITGGYGLIALLTLLYINNQVVGFTDNNSLVAAIIAVLVFCFFNFRKKAKCFAGDVGSISLAFIVLFFLLQLIIKTQQLNYVLLLLVYGLDSVTTLVFRLIRRENIFEAHRSHFYQFLANEKQMPHLLVSILYMLMQGAINVIVLKSTSFNIVVTLIALIVVTLFFIFLRIKIEGDGKTFKIR